MFMLRQWALLLVVLGTLSACQPEAKPDEYNKKVSDTKFLYACSKKLTDVIIHDIFKPPVASRIYGYTYLAAYEALRPAHPNYEPLMGRVNGSSLTPPPQKGISYCFPLASLKAFLTVSRSLTFSQDLWEGFETDLLQTIKDTGIPTAVYDRSIAYGDQVANHVLAYANEDHYNQTRGFRYTVTNKPGTWVPTPPAYADACEPQWNSVRSFTLDSAQQFRCPPPTRFDMTENSLFVKLTQEVYQIGKTLTEEQRQMAYFWDDNAFVTNVSGHVTFASKKMTPAGHWLAIATTLARKEKLDMMPVVELYSLTSIALYDAFIACWDEKYRSIRIRPETVINAHIDPNWRPFLESPAFPEYVSGHSAISASAGQVMAHLLKTPLAFVDSTEYPYGHGVRSFASIRAAYEETTMSRIYGGIHFRDGVEEGTRQGQKVGQWVLTKLKPTPETVASK